MPEIEITFGGLRSLEYDERVDVDHALTCDDCNVDYGGIQPRNGYRAAGLIPSFDTVVRAFTNQVITHPGNTASISVLIPAPPAGYWYSQAYWVLSAVGSNFNDPGTADTITRTWDSTLQTIAIRANGAYSGTLEPDRAVYVPLNPNPELTQMLIAMQAATNYVTTYTIGGNTTGSTTVNLWLVMQTVPILSTSTVTVGTANHVVASGATYQPTFTPPAPPSGQNWVRAFVTVTGTTAGAATDVLTIQGGGSFAHAYNVVHGGATISFTQDFFDQSGSSNFQQLKLDASAAQAEGLYYKNNSAGNETITLTVTLESAIVPAYGAAFPQGVWRFRPKSAQSAPNDARTITVQGGATYAVTDPSTEINQDAVVAFPSGQVGFLPTAQISGAQLGKYLYIGSDQAATAWQRVKPDFTMESIAALQPGTTPTVTYSTLATVLFNPAGVTMTNALVGCTISTIFTDWVKATPSTTPNTLTFDTGAPANWDAYAWLAVMITPSDGNAGNNTVSILVSSAPTSAFEQLGVINDTAGTDTPFVVYVPLNGLTSGTRAAVRYIQFSSNNTASYAVYGYMLVPTAPAVGIQQYFLDTYSSTSQETSGLFPALKADGTGGISVTYIQGNIVIPTFHAVSQSEGSYYNAGINSLDPSILVNNPARFYNASQPTAYPTRDQFSSIPTFTGTAPAGSYDTLRLWRLTTTGIRLVTSQAQTPGAGYTITDSAGVYTLSNQLYIPGGPPPACIAMCGAGGRLVAGGDPANPARFYVSSYLAFGQDIDPFPQFPAVPSLITDGWAADLAPTAAEQILALEYGDNVVYMLSNEGCYVLASTDAPLYGPPPFQEVWRKGVIGREAACWADDKLFWAAHDGVYMARNRNYGGELTGAGNPNLPGPLEGRVSVNRLYRTWLLPDSTTVVTYQDGCLNINRGNLYMRYHFLTNTWSRGTLANTMLFAANWRDPTGTIQHLWYLDSAGNLQRWQPGTYWGDPNRATSDNGTAIANWVYSTGYDMRTIRSLTEGFGNFRTRVQWAWLETDGSASVAFYKDSGASGSRAITVAAGQTELPLPPDFQSYVFRLQFTAANSVRILKALWQRNKVDSKGG